jgi:hypothetical protein
MYRYRIVATIIYFTKKTMETTTNSQALIITNTIKKDKLINELMNSFEPMNDSLLKKAYKGIFGYTSLQGKVRGTGEYFTIEKTKKKYEKTQIINPIELIENIERELKSLSAAQILSDTRFSYEIAKINNNLKGYYVEKARRYITLRNNSISKGVKFNSMQAKALEKTLTKLKNIKTQEEKTLKTSKLEHELADLIS